MNLTSRRYTDKGKRLLIGMCLSAFICGYNSVSAANYPSWWTNRGVMVNVAVTNDFAAVNAGQLKWIAVKAKEELDEKLTGGAGAGVNTLIASFTSSNNYLAVNAGQLKNVAAPFWARMIEVGYTNVYPWPVPPATNANDFAMANIGQVKNVFSFDLAGFSGGLDSDGDGMPDDWELANGLNPNDPSDALLDSDNDGVSNLDEYLNGTNPRNSDTDGDGMPDKWESDHSFNPNDPSDALLDTDGDDLKNLDEYKNLTDPRNPDTDGDGLSDGFELNRTKVVWWGYGGDNHIYNVWVGASNVDCRQSLMPEGINDSIITAIDCGDCHGVALRSDGNVICWGWDGSSYCQTIVPPNLTNAVAISAGKFMDVALTSDRQVVCWGSKRYGQWYVPRIISDVVSVSAGGYHKIALLANNTVVCWTRDGVESVPVGLSNVIAISGGGYHNMALKSDGTVVCWGRTSDPYWVDYGQATVPVGLSGVTAISGGYDHSMALKSDKTVVCWGNNDYGQCRVPDGLSGVIAISAGQAYSMALKSDGSIVCWGEEGLGSGVTNVPAGLSAIAIAAGTGASMALCRLGSLHPLSPDTDRDGMPDGWEVKNGLDPLVNDAALDSDNDGFTNIQEKQQGTHPLRGDSDFDGFSDYQEINVTHTDPMNRDSDNDYLSDGEEAGVPKGSDLYSYPGNPIFFSNPMVTDSDGDGMDDWWETASGLDPLVDDAMVDIDEDGVDNLTEYREYKLSTSTLGMVSGFNQPVSTDTFLPEPYVIQITAADGNGVAGANVYFFVETGLLSDNNTAGGLTNITVQTDSLGYARVYYKQPAGLNGSNRYITAYILTGNHGAPESGRLSVNPHYGNGNFSYGPAYTGRGRITGVKINTTYSLISAPDIYCGLKNETDNKWIVGEKWATEPMEYPDEYPAPKPFGIRASKTFGLYGGGGGVFPNGNQGMLRLSFDLPSADLDGDGLLNEEEDLLGTDATDCDSDDDNMSDKYEVQNGLNPLSDDRAMDADNDGLNNFNEMRYGSDSKKKDTDGDGVEDGVEVLQGSDPADPDDGGKAENCVRISLTIGDESGSNSERWEMEVGAHSIHHQSLGWGEVSTETYAFVKGKEYPFSVRHIDSNQSPPDYDYTATIGGFGNLQPAWYCGNGFIIDDSAGLLGTTPESGGEVNPALGKNGILYVIKADLKVDTDRNGTVDESDDAGEDTITTTKGALVVPSKTNLITGLTQLIVQPIVAALPSGFKLRLKKADANTQTYLKIYKADTTEISFTSGYADITTSAQSGLTLYMASTVADTPLQSTPLQFSVALEVVDSANTVISSDTVALRVAPLIIPWETAPVEKVYSVQAIAGIPNLQAVGSSGFQWAQDFVKIGQCQKSTHDITPVVADLHHPIAGDFVTKLSDIEHLHNVEWPYTTGDGGNLMIAPPLSGYPFGRPIIGSKDTSFKRYLDGQGVQKDTVTPDTDWLAVGHVDEVMMFVNNNTILIADPWKAADLLHQEIAAGYEANTLWFGVGEAATINKLKTILQVVVPNSTHGYKKTTLPTALPNSTTDAVIAFPSVLFEVGDYLRVDNEILLVTAVNGSNVTVQRAKAGRSATVHSAGAVIYAYSLVMQQNLPLVSPNSDCAVNNINSFQQTLVAAGFSVGAYTYVGIPVLFDLDPDNSGKFVAYTANAVNCLVIPGGGIFYSDTGCQVFSQYIQAALPGASAINVWANFHCYRGEVHCATATRRTVPCAPQWWNNN